MATCQGRHPLMHRTSIDPPVCPSRFEESLQTPGGTVQRDFRLAAPLELQTKNLAQWTRNRRGRVRSHARIMAQIRRLRSEFNAPLVMSGSEGRADVVCQGLSGPFIARCRNWRDTERTELLAHSDAVAWGLVSASGSDTVQTLIRLERDYWVLGLRRNSPEVRILRRLRRQSDGDSGA